jgi:hypothetical protein
MCSTDNVSDLTEDKEMFNDTDPEERVTAF